MHYINFHQLEAISIYNQKRDAESKGIITNIPTPEDKVYKLLEPQMIEGTFILWKVPTIDSRFSLSKTNSIVHVSQQAEFETFQQALFAKLRYERTNSDFMYRV